MSKSTCSRTDGARLRGETSEQSVAGRGFFTRRVVSVNRCRKVCAGIDSCSGTVLLSSRASPKVVPCRNEILLDFLLSVDLSSRLKDNRQDHTRHFLRVFNIIPSIAFLTCLPGIPRLEPFYVSSGRSQTASGPGRQYEHDLWRVKDVDLNET